MENKDKIVVKLSWVPFWIAGFMFTFAITGGFTVFANQSIDGWTKIAATIVCYVIWPLSLGLYFAK